MQIINRITGHFSSVLERWFGDRFSWKYVKRYVLYCYAFWTILVVNRRCQEEQRTSSSTRTSMQAGVVRVELQFSLAGAWSRLLSLSPPTARSRTHGDFRRRRQLIKFWTCECRKMKHLFARTNYVLVSPANCSEPLGLESWQRIERVNVNGEVTHRIYLSEAKLLNPAPSGRSRWTPIDTCLNYFRISFWYFVYLFFFVIASQTCNKLIYRCLTTKKLISCKLSFLIILIDSQIYDADYIVLVCNLETLK